MTTLRILLGDQLDRDSEQLRQYAPGDVLWMAELPQESLHVPSHKARSVYFLSAMRHFAQNLVKRGFVLDYSKLGNHPWTTFEDALHAAIETHQPKQLAAIEPGEMRVRSALERVAKAANLPLEWLTDDHFLSTPQDFANWAEGRKALRMEYFYREMRKRYGILMDGDEPADGQWNFDSKNRKSFGKHGPGMLEQPAQFRPAKITADVIECVEQHFPDNPGSVEHFDWPVTPDAAQKALRDFIDHRLCAFGDFQDAMWTDEPWLYHARISAALNLKLLNPRDVIADVEAAWLKGDVAINAAEGFIRQVLGWREYIRGLYFLHYKDFEKANALGADQPLPAFYWTGKTHMQCLAQSIGQTLDTGYAHHIQRLMVTGLFSLLLGVQPQEIHAWYLAIYIDAVEWVEMPNTVGMSQFADGGITASKPYIASGKYIQRMSNYCDNCRYKPDKRSGEEACPFTVFYWDFLLRHKQRFANHPRMALQCRNLSGLNREEIKAIQDTAVRLRGEVDTL